MLRQRQPRVHNDKHLDFIRGLPCVICKDNTSTEAAHVRMSDLRAGKESNGLGQKPHDMWCVPLCGLHHRDQHLNNEREWWNTHGIDATKLAMALYLNSGDQEAGERIIEAYTTRQP